jgi:hypothetical protein
MTIEPNLRAHERNWTGKPYGYGRMPGTAKIQPPGETLNAVSRPQLIRKKDRDSGGHGQRKRKFHEAETFRELWDMFRQWLGELPGFIESLVGLLLSPLRILRWLFTAPGVRVASVVVTLAVLAVLALPMTTCSLRDAPRAEGEQLLGAARDMLRTEHSRTDDAGQMKAAFKKAVRHGDFKGSYFNVSNWVVPTSETGARIYVYPDDPARGIGYMDFEWESGSSEVHWEEEWR